MAAGRDILEEKYPHIRFKESDYNYAEPLTNRGQKSASAFYVNDATAKKILVKKDDLATCVLEGATSCVREFLPAAYRQCINCASTEIITSNDEPAQSAVVTIQDAIDAEKLDEIIYGKKRDPHTLFSYESKYSNQILQKISEMTEQAKNELAVGIFASTLLGDESIHAAQFLAKRNAAGEINGVVRIDLGARERYGLHRTEKWDFKHQTSKPYAKSGQFGKDYISFWLADPSIMAKYLQLWILMKTRLADFVYKNKDEFNKSFIKIPEGLQAHALDEIYKLLLKKSGKKEKKGDISGEKYLKVLNMLEEISKTRVELMYAAAQAEVEDKLRRLEPILEANADAILTAIRAIVFYESEDKAVTMEHLATIVMHEPFQHADPIQAKEFLSILDNIEAAFQFKPNPEEYQEALDMIDSLRKTLKRREDLGPEAGMTRAPLA